MNQSNLILYSSLVHEIIIEHYATDTYEIEVGPSYIEHIFTYGDEKFTSTIRLSRTEDDRVTIYMEIDMPEGYIKGYIDGYISAYLLDADASAIHFLRDIAKYAQRV